MALTLNDFKKEFMVASNDNHDIEDAQLKVLRRYKHIAEEVTVFLLHRNLAMELSFLVGNKPSEENFVDFANAANEFGNEHKIDAELLHDAFDYL